ncbi:hypothetical protein GOV10_02870 [Candidatus Woesearchaeota archaeon]|nr:hypothetical protein [Candidatus Woesearchaeota archaeon]
MTRQMPQFENARYLASGCNADVFVVEFEGEEYALKANRIEQEFLCDRYAENAEKEVSVLRALEGIEGLPVVKAVFPGEFIREEMLLPHHPILKYNFFRLSTPFLMTYFDAPQLLLEMPAKSFYVELEEMVTQIHVRGYAMPTDFGPTNTLVLDNRPKLIDWNDAEKLPEDILERQKIITKNIVRAREMGQYAR